VGIARLFKRLIIWDHNRPSVEDRRIMKQVKSQLPQTMFPVHPHADIHPYNLGGIRLWDVFTKGPERRTIGTIYERKIRYPRHRPRS